MTIFSIGHSSNTIESFLKLSEVADVIIDVRSHPGSHFEQYRKEEMQEWLPSFGKKYEWWPQLGGWTDRHSSFKEEMQTRNVDVSAYCQVKFPKQRIAKTLEHSDSKDIKPQWYNQGLYDYSWFMSLNEFISGAEELISRGKIENIAIMCCESLWWKCHRGMISDYIVWRGEDIFHLMSRMRQKNKIKFVDGTKEISHLKSISNRIERYDTDIVKLWSR